MKRSKKENKQKVDSTNYVIWAILIIGAIIGVILGCRIELNAANIYEYIACRIIFCAATAFEGSLFTLFFVYYVSEAIEEIQNYREERKVKKEGRGFID